MARRVSSRWVALLIAYLTLATSVSWRFVVLHNWDSTLWLCLAVYCSVLLAQTRQARWAFGAGTFGSLTFLFEQSKGAGFVLGLLLAFILLACIERPLRFSRAHGFALAAGFVWPLALTLVYFAGHHALGAMFADWSWAFHHYSVTNNVPYGYTDWSDEARASLFGTFRPFDTLIVAVTVSPCFPAIATRRAETEVELRDGQSFAIAGLLNEQDTAQLSKIPGIGDVPILGRLFQSRSIQKSKSELVVLVTPRIVDPIGSGAQMKATPAPVLPSLDIPKYDPGIPGHKQLEQPAPSSPAK
jgi:hypothetical protein